MSHKSGHVIINFLEQPVSQKVPSVKRWHVAVVVALVVMLWLIF